MSFFLDLAVRDYECDVQGIVNNSVYLNYFEHTRHQYLINRGYSFSQLMMGGYFLMVVESHIHYRYPLKDQDSFKVLLRVEKHSPVRLIFHQEIVQEQKVFCTGKFVVTGKNKEGKIIIPKKLMEVL